MTTIRYVGPADIRHLTSADLKKADVEGFRSTRFVRGEATEVDDNVAEALLGHPLFDGQFEEVAQEEPKAVEGPESQDELPLTDETGGGARDSVDPAATASGGVTDSDVAPRTSARSAKGRTR